MKDRYTVRIAGFGGQGVVLSGLIVGKAASLYDGKSAAFTQSYGPEARGGACRANVVIEKGKVRYPLVKQADALIALSKAGYERYGHEVGPDAFVFVDSDLVKEAPIDNKRVFGIPATRLAESMGQKIVANIIMLGFFAGVTQSISKKAMLESIKTSVKEAFVEINVTAVEKGDSHRDTATSERTERIPAQNI